MTRTPSPPETSSSPEPPGPQDAVSPRGLDRMELEQLADRIIELMKREVIISYEREGKQP